MDSQAYVPISEMEHLMKLQIFQTPLPLITSDIHGNLSVVEGTISQLEEIPFGVNVIAIAGLYRTGKSYLMNRLAQVSPGFELGNATQAKTKGIWIWCKQHPEQPGQVLVLLDTEGLGDVKRGDTQYDNKIFTLACLLSSTLVYNMMGAFNQDAIEKLTFITEMSKHMKVGDGMGGDKCIDFVLPKFVLCLRDFRLKLEADGRECTEDEYLDDCLKSKQVETPEDEKFNRPRECIKKYFTRRKLLTFDRPGLKKVMMKLETANDDELSEEFLADTVKFTSYIFQCEPMMLLNRKLVTGSMLANLAREYANAMKAGGVPCVDDAMTTMAKIENEKLIRKAVSSFKEEMEKIELPVCNITQLHKDTNDNQLSFLMDLVKSFPFDDKNEAQKSAKNQMDNIVLSINEKNNQLLRELCTKTLEELYRPLEEKISNGYNVAGGYQIYMKDMSELENKYSTEHSNVDQALRQDVLIAFRKRMRENEDKILNNDQHMSEQEREGERKRRDEMEEQMLKNTNDLKSQLEQQKRDNENKIAEMIKQQKEHEDAHFQETIEKLLKARGEQETTVQKLILNIEKLKKKMENAETSSDEGGCLIL